jgi:hypothetical protein
VSDTPPGRRRGRPSRREPSPNDGRRLALPPVAGCLIAALLGSLLAGGLWFISIDAWSRTQDLQARGVVVAAEVLETYAAGRGSPEGADVRFTTEDRSVVVGFADGVAGTTPVGTQVDVVYDPVHPDRIRAAADAGDDGLAIVLGGLATLATPFPFAALVTAAWRVVRVARWRLGQRVAG